MRNFTDSTGRSWTIAINVNAIKRVRALVQVDLLEAADGRLIEKLVSDPVLLCDVIYALCKEQADAAGIDDEAFGRAMAGDAIDAAVTALLEELVDFFPLARRRVLGKALAKLRQLEATAMTTAETQLDDPALDRKLAELLRWPGSSSGTAPESLALTPEP